MTRLSLVPLTIAVLAACASVEARLCDRLDECNALTGSVEECASDAQDALGDLSDSDEKDCEAQIDACLENESCDNFLVCNVDKCGFGTYYYYYTGYY